MLNEVVQKPAQDVVTMTDRLDRVLTHPVSGVLIFVVLMVIVFQAIFSWAAPLQNLLERLVSAVGGWISAVMPVGVLQSLLADGVVAGVGAVLAFLPQIAMLFLFVAILEDCGYMARAAYLMDGMMSRVGLSGKSFIPLLSSFACAVPGIMATRVIENRRDRLVTMLVAPLMSCSARLPVYTLMISAFIPNRRYLGGWCGLQGMTILALYALGIVVAVGVAKILRRTMLKGETPPFVMELPDYRFPSLRVVGGACRGAMLGICLWRGHVDPGGDGHRVGGRLFPASRPRGGRSAEPIRRAAYRTRWTAGEISAGSQVQPPTPRRPHRWPIWSSNARSWRSHVQSRGRGVHGAESARPIGEVDCACRSTAGMGLEDRLCRIGLVPGAGSRHRRDGRDLQSGRRAGCGVLLAQDGAGQPDVARHRPACVHNPRGVVDHGLLCAMRPMCGDLEHDLQGDGEPVVAGVHVLLHDMPGLCRCAASRTRWARGWVREPCAALRLPRRSVEEGWRSHFGQETECPWQTRFSISWLA